MPNEQSWDEHVLADAIEKGTLRWWGSDCTACGNATPGSMRCDECGSAKHTRHLYVAGEKGAVADG